MSWTRVADLRHAARDTSCNIEYFPLTSNTWLDSILNGALATSTWLQQVAPPCLFPLRSKASAKALV